VERFRQKIVLGDIQLPMVRMEKSQKSALGIHVTDLAAYIDARRKEAARELDAMRG
jgi:hypothetical protein